MILSLIVILAAGLRFWQIGSIPGEMWGDVIEHYKLVLAIQRGHSVWSHWWGSDGPIFPYMAYIVSIFTHLSFDSLKITSAIIGSLGVIAEYYMALGVSKNKRLALIACFLVGVSF